MTKEMQTVHWEEPRQNYEATAAFDAQEQLALRVQAKQREAEEAHNRVVAENKRARAAKLAKVKSERAAFDRVKAGSARPDRESVEEYAAWLFEHGDKPQDASAWHFGRCEIKALMDFVYGCGK